MMMTELCLLLASSCWLASDPAWLLSYKLEDVSTACVSQTKMGRYTVELMFVESLKVGRQSMKQECDMCCY